MRIGMEGGNPAIAVDLDKVGVGGMVVWVEQQRRICRIVRVLREHVRYVDVKQRVAVDDDEALLKLVEAGQRGSRRSLGHAVVDQPYASRQAGVGDKRLDLSDRMVN